VVEKSVDSTYVVPPTAKGDVRQHWSDINAAPNSIGYSRKEDIYLLGRVPRGHPLELDTRYIGPRHHDWTHCNDREDTGGLTSPDRRRSLD
jgi:hypothetical protein